MCDLKGMWMTTPKCRNEVKPEFWSGAGERIGVFYFESYLFCPRIITRNILKLQYQTVYLSWKLTTIELSKLMRGVLWYSCLWYVETRPGDPYCFLPWNGLKSDPFSCCLQLLYMCKIQELCFTGHCIHIIFGADLHVFCLSEFHFKFIEFEQMQAIRGKCNYNRVALSCFPSDKHGLVRSD